MDKIYISIISTLIIIIISISIYILIKTGFYNSIIKELQSENKYLLSQISSAESLIDFQNAKINNYAVNMKKVEEKYMQARDSAICSKVPYEEMNKIRMRLLELGYYNDALYLLQDENFVRLLDKKTLKIVVDKYRSFLGVNSCQVTEESLVRFLRQFLWLEIDKKELGMILLL